MCSRREEREEKGTEASFRGLRGEGRGGLALVVKLGEACIGTKRKGPARA